MQIPILSGIYAKQRDFRTSYPRNYVPVPKDQGISKGYLKPSPGLDVFATGPGTDRGGINWRGKLYRVMGTKLISVSAAGAVVEVGDVGGTGPVRFSYSFDRLAVSSGGKLFYLQGSTLTPVTDPDLGTVLDHVWKDGYFVTTDGDAIVVTELNDPEAVDPLKYGSSETDPDPIIGLIDIAGELAAINRNSIEFFQNVGGDNFPFQVIQGAEIQRGAVGTHAFCKFTDVIAMIGSGRNEAPSVYLAASGQSKSIATAEIDTILRGYTEAVLAKIIVESVVDQQHQFLYIHLPDRTLVYDGAATAATREPVWFVLTSGTSALGQYRARNFVWCYDRWVFGDPSSSNLGVPTEVHSNHYGAAITWEFGTTILYNESRGAIMHALELIGLPGGAAFGADPVIWTSYSLDGEGWSQERPVSAGKFGQMDKRIVWRRQGHMRNWRIQRFRGTSDGHLAIARLEAQLEALNA